MTAHTLAEEESCDATNDSQDKRHYDSIQVVALHWRGQGQEGFIKEAEMVVKTSERLGWAARRLSIPPDGKIRNLLQQALDFSPQNEEKRLFILHYGGHGSKVRRTMQGAPSRDGFGDPAIDFRTYQSIVKEQVDYDMLGVLDGCNLGFEGWADSIGERNGRCIEILTAGGRAIETPGPGDSKSFTPIFLEELETAIREEGSITVDGLRHRLIKRNQLVIEPNCLGASRKNERSIYLEPLRSYQQLPQHNISSASQDSSTEATPGVSTRVSRHLSQDRPTSPSRVSSTPPVDSESSGTETEVPESHEAPEIDEKSFPRQLFCGSVLLVRAWKRISPKTLKKKAKTLASKLKR